MVDGGNEMRTVVAFCRMTYIGAKSVTTSHFLEESVNPSVLTHVVNRNTATGVIVRYISKTSLKEAAIRTYSSTLPELELLYTIIGAI